MSARVTALIERYQRVADERMRGLPIVNPALQVEAVGFEAFDAHELGILITPWFMNLIVLPGSADWDDHAQGVEVEWRLPAGVFRMTVCREEDFGAYLSSVLFRTVSDFPDQATARAIAAEILGELRREPEARATEGANARSLSRRDLFTQLGTN